MANHDAGAFLRRQGAMSCMFHPEQVREFIASAQWKVTGNQLQWRDFSGDNSAGILYCALPDDDAAPVKNLAWISFQGYDASSNWNGDLSATACFTFESGVHIPGGMCDTPVSSGTAYVGPVDLSLSTTFFNDKGTYDFPYVMVSVPAPGPGDGYSSFWGINWAA